MLWKVAQFSAGSPSLQALDSLVLVGLGLFGSLVLAIAREKAHALSPFFPSHR